jgi:hypothetical protein
MKMGRLVAIIAVLSLSLLVFLVAFNSTILGAEKTSESTTEMLISQIQDLRKEIEALKERISKLEGGQKISPTVPQVPSPTVSEDLPVDINPNIIPIAPRTGPAQKATGVVRGHIVDTSEAQLPIEGVLVVIVDVSGSEYETMTDSSGEYTIIGLTPGRYLISVYKDGYGDRTGKPVTVVAGGDHYVPLKMTKKAGLVDLLPGDFDSSFGLLLLCVGSAFLLGYLIGRIGRHSD